MLRRRIGAFSSTDHGPQEAAITRSMYVREQADPHAGQRQHSALLVA
jgi:hypothetical protein